MAGRDLLPIDPKRHERDRARVERGFWDKIRRTLGRVPFVEEAVAAYYCTLDPETPFRVKAILLGALAYFVLPADLIPDFIAGLGFTDDAAVVAAAIRSVAPAITERHRDKARAALSPGGPRREAA
jgi:uncharacterized membrane protein YkvA (DUF1232 family)